MSTWTKCTESSGKGEVSFINLAPVRRMVRISNDVETRIFFADGRDMNVREKPEELIGEQIHA